MIQQLALKTLQKLDPEISRKITQKLFTHRLLPTILGVSKIGLYPTLSASFFGLDFPNPIALSGGFDKNGNLSDTLMKIGLGYVEIGTVTPRSQPGNQKPRLFRLSSDNAIINNFGLENSGFDEIHNQLSSRKNRTGTIGINIGYNKDSQDYVEDFIKGIKKFSDIANYYVLNISCPNICGSQSLHEKEELVPLLEKVMNDRDKLPRNQNHKIPVFIKMSPDLDDNKLSDVCEAVLKFKVDGLVISNTTLLRENLSDTKYSNNPGGLSGKPLFNMSTRILAKVRNIVGPDVVIIGVGGIDSGETAWAKITAGANLLQLYTGLTYHGFDLITEILDYLSYKVELNKFDNLQQAVGISTKDWLTK